MQTGQKREAKLGNFEAALLRTAAYAAQWFEVEKAVSDTSK